MPETKHPTHIDGYYGSLQALANSIGDMRYDKVAEFVGLLAQRVEAEAERDSAAGRTQLSGKLDLVSKHLYNAQAEIDSAWKICEPHMKDQD
ncbi:hypothetical protein HYV87_05030 [Candidatus Woesearchaeota archaeon]|nr:hypothetical protein [Candidatus Woesearchaeota archaeon]